MKKIILSASVIFMLATTTQAQYFNIGKKKTNAPEETKPVEAPSLLNDWQKTKDHQIVFFDKWPGTTFDETSSNDMIELGEDFWFRAYFDKGLGVDRKKPLDLRISCDGISLTMKDIWAYSKANYYATNGVLPAFDQLHLPGMEQWWRTSNVYGMCGMITPEEFDKAGSPGYGCNFNDFPGEVLFHMFLAKINDKIIYGNTLDLKYELIQRESGNYYDTEGGAWIPVASGNLKLHVGDKAKNISGNLYRFPATPGMNDTKLTEAIKAAMLSKSGNVVAEVYKISVIENAYHIYSNSLTSVPINRWVTARVLFKSKIDGYIWSGNVTASFAYNGTGYETGVGELFYQCGLIPVPSFGIPK